jgi:hypothetical protein
MADDDRSMICPACKGRQVFIASDGQQMVCYNCDGNGRVLKPLRFNHASLNPDGSITICTANERPITAIEIVKKESDNA